MSCTNNFLFCLHLLVLFISKTTSKVLNSFGVVSQLSHGAEAVVQTDLPYRNAPSLCPFPAMHWTKPKRTLKYLFHFNPLLSGLADLWNPPNSKLLSLTLIALPLIRNQSCCISTVTFHKMRLGI